MTSRKLSERTHQPGNFTGLVISLTSVCALAGCFWWFGISPTDQTLTTLSIRQYGGGIVVGLLFSLGTLSIHARPEIRERWRTSLRLRLIAGVSVGIGLGLLVSVVPVILAVGFVVLAITFALGRSYLFITARPDRSPR